MRPNHASANIGNRNLAAPCFQINRGIDRYLEVEINVADIAASAIVPPDIDNQGVAGLPRQEVSLRGFKRSGKFDLVAVPRLNCDGSGNIFQLDANIFSGRISFRQTLLSIDAAYGQRSKGEKGHEHHNA